MPIDGKQRDGLEPGTRLEARYKKQAYGCEVVAGDDGKLRFRLEDGQEFKSPSAAGKAVMGGVACNGWRFWSIASEETTEEPKPAAKRKTARKAKAEKPSADDSPADVLAEAEEAATGTP